LARVGITEAYINLSDLGIEQDFVMNARQTKVGVTHARILPQLIEMDRSDPSTKQPAWLQVWLNETFGEDERAKSEVLNWMGSRLSEETNAAGVLSGVFPIFDASFLNTSEQPAILSEIKVGGYMFLEGGSVGATNTAKRHSQASMCMENSAWLQMLETVSLYQNRMASSDFQWATPEVIVR
jgi:hypothetical protein